MRGKNLKDTISEKVKENENERTDYTVIENDNNRTSIIEYTVESSAELQIVPEFAITLNEARQRLQLLQRFVKEMMIENIDYGIIAGCKKPSLYKSGAEKLCDIFGFSKHIEVVNRLEDWEKKIFHYEVKAILISKKSGMIEAEGIGNCNNKEKKYAYQDPYSVINTILKMAKKRAFVDAVLSATRSSAIFTQDLEDLDNRDKQNSKQDTKPSKPSGKTENGKSMANKTQLSRVVTAIKQVNISFEKAKDIMIDRYQVTDSKMLTSNQVEDFVNYLKSYKAM